MINIRKLSIIFLALSFMVFSIVGAFAAADGFGATGLTGGTTGKLDAIDVTLDGVDGNDVCVVKSAGVVYEYYFNASSGAAESSPDIIKPDLSNGVSYSGNGRWILQGVYAATFQSASGTSINEFSTDGTLAGNSDNAVPTEKAAKTYVDATVQSSDDVVPAGAVMGFAMNTCPSGWVAADGAAVSRTVTYDTLFAAISDDYGNGNGSTTFNLPNYEGNFLRGWDNSAGVDPDAASRTDRGDGTTGDNVGTNQANYGANVSHTHTGPSHTHTGTFTGYGTGSSAGGIQSGYLQTDNSGNTWHTTSAPATGAGGTGASGENTGAGTGESRPVNISVLYCIKY